MWKFIKENSYKAVTMLVTQFAISIFGLVLALVGGMAKSRGLMIGTSIGAILFYMFLLYTGIWEMGAKDKIAVEYGRKPSMPLKGLYISLIANSPNILLAILIALGALIPALGEMGTACSSIAIFMQGMYSGVLSLETGIEAAPRLNGLWFMYFITPLPALGFTTMGYFMGTKDLRLFAFTGPSRKKKK